jgi:hypothetical protein
MIPQNQHQNTAPGPPRATASDIPIIFPTPSVAAKVVVRQENEERPLFEEELKLSLIPLKM